ncbi:hypothetical protein GWI33_004200 [Rhynchophorus ferrugineus]|uniref:Uncharacterized protein n=1 Tax=Rhynchophorus ferrugineus TaxID=354439 RepID=A0A834IYZ3_RHYFE|nr:hypothetical protein GWI33_004200 [Rhynchophorus ferrugineus]
MFYFSLILLNFLASVLAYGTMTPEQRQRFLTFQGECMMESGTTEEMLLKAFMGEFTESSVFKDHLVCLGMKTGVIDDEGNYHKDILKEEILSFIGDETKVDDILDTCYIHYDTPQESAFNMMKCMFKEHFGV